MNPELTPTEIFAEKTAKLAAVEVGLGSVLHSLHLPLSGVFLSLNQIFWLSRWSFQNRSKPWVSNLAAWVSGATAILKSFAPSGKKLTPMTAILVQGVIFGLPMKVIGPKRSAIFLGAMHSSVWSFLQPLLLAYLVFGRVLFEASWVLYEKWVHALGLENFKLWILVSVCVLLKSSAASFLALLAWRDETSKLEVRLATLSRVSPNLSPNLSQAQGWSSFRQWKRVLFWAIPLAISGIFLLSIDAPFQEWILWACRPLAVVVVLQFLFRLTRTARSKITWIKDLSQVAEMAKERLK